jgi:DNA-binding MarR family transcriptional regulator
MQSMNFGRTLGMRLRGAYLTLHRCLNLTLRESGVTADQFVVLSLLAEEDGPTQGEIAQRCSSDPSTVGALLRLLEGKGLVNRRRHPEDGRARSICLTPKGRELHKRAWKVSMIFQKALGDSLHTSGERDVVLTVLDRIRDTMTGLMTTQDPSE